MFRGFITPPSFACEERAPARGPCRPLKAETMGEPGYESNNRVVFSRLSQALDTIIDNLAELDIKLYSTPMYKELREHIIAISDATRFIRRHLEIIADRIDTVIEQISEAEDIISDTGCSDEMFKLIPLLSSVKHSLNLVKSELER